MLTCKAKIVNMHNIIPLNINILALSLWADTSIQLQAQSHRLLVSLKVQINSIWVENVLIPLGEKYLWLCNITSGAVGMMCLAQAYPNVAIETMSLQADTLLWYPGFMAIKNMVLVVEWLIPANIL